MLLLIPAREASLILPPPRPLRGVIMRRREAGRGAVPAGLAQQDTRAAPELPPGPLGVPARSWLTTGGPFGCSRHRKRGPVLQKRRCWRAARRPPCPATDMDTIGLRLSARHPPLTRGASRRASCVGEIVFSRHARTCSGHPIERSRMRVSQHWIAGTSPAMTKGRGDSGPLWSRALGKLEMHATRKMWTMTR
jgi:hypothetical protein